jgi:capsular exopolysaccharide synthesis family protein
MSAFAEAARSIRTSIAFSSPDQPLRTLLVTSAEASDGKTTVASNLAIAMAQTGQKVILVDCDLRRSRIHDIYHVDNQHGLTSAVIGPRPVEAALIESEVPGLRLLPSGPLPPNPSELLHSKAFREMLEQLRRLADVVIIDSPPLVPVTDAAVISTNVDAVVLVARSFKTSRVAAERAVRILRDVGGKGIGFVLNALEGSGVGSGYYAAYARRSNSDRPPAA